MGGYSLAHKRSIEALLREEGYTDFELLRSNTHMVYRVKLKCGVERHVTFSGSPSDWRVIPRIRSLLKQLEHKNAG